MGCINSTDKHLYALKRDDIYNVSVVRVQSDHSVVLAKQGFLEINPQELIFVAPEQEPVAWALQHLRRYGLTGNVFSFEAGRRCPTGPGIYTFRCSNATQFYSKFQRCINSMTLSTDRNNTSIHHSHIFERLDNHQSHTNHYLEPTSVHISAAMDERIPIHESFSNDSNELDLNSPDSIHSTSVTAEIIHFPPSVPSYSNVDPNPQICSSNIYMEQPIRSNIERNNNMCAHEGIDTSRTINQKSLLKPLLKSASLDVPPEECAPVLSTNSIETRLYENIDSKTLKSNTLQNISSTSFERCYANIELPRLDSLQIGQSKSFQADSGNEKQQKTLTNGPIVNYIVLDLDQPRSPSQCSPKNGFGSGQSLSGSGSNIFNIKKDDVSPSTFLINSGSSTMPKGSSINEKLTNNEIESSGSYTRIDFLKTFALMKSSTNYNDFDPDNDQEESRITRHSKFVRKAYSISE